MLGLIGKKKGMTQVFDSEGVYISVTVVELGPCTRTQKKTKDSDGYEALQLGFGTAKASRVSKPMKGHFAKNSLPLHMHIKEFRIEDTASFNVGDELIASGFKAGDTVQVRGTSKGRGFQGVMKRHGKHGGPATHGSHFHRTPGSIGMRTWPARVFKNMKLPGHMGVDKVMIKNLDVVDVRPEDNVILIRGAIPGHNNSIVEVFLTNEALEIRETLKKVALETKLVEDANENNVIVDEAAPVEEVKADVQRTEEKG